MAKHIYDLTDNEIRQIVNDMFQPNKITCIKRHKKEDAISCAMYTEWEGDKKLGEKDFTMRDEVFIKTPFEYGTFAIETDFPVKDQDIFKLKQFLYAKGIVPDELAQIPDHQYIRNNPYIEGVPAVTYSSLERAVSVHRSLAKQAFKNPGAAGNHDALIIAIEGLMALGDKNDATTIYTRYKKYLEQQKDHKRKLAELNASWKQIS